MRYNEIIKTLENTYKVNDVNLENCKLIFILESPHVQEIKHGVPVAGASGLTMTKSLFGSDFITPLGQMLRGNNQEIKDTHELIKDIGLMNVCQIPMQRTAYSQEDANRFHDFFDDLEKIRTTPQRRHYKQPNLNNLQNVILQLFRKRLSDNQGRQVTIVPCGRFAQKFLYLAKEIEWDVNWRLIEDVPHPSYNSWARERYKPVINRVYDRLKEQ